MKKPVEIYVFSILYVLLGAFVVVGYLYLVFTNWKDFTFTSYNAVDVIYSAEAAEFMAKFVLGPSIFLGGVIALPSSLLILLSSPLKAYGYYGMLVSSVLWTLPIIGLFTIIVFLKSEIREFLLE